MKKLIQLTEVNSLIYKIMKRILFTIIAMVFAISCAVSQQETTHSRGVKIITSNQITTVSNDQKLTLIDEADAFKLKKISLADLFLALGSPQSLDIDDANEQPNTILMLNAAGQYEHIPSPLPPFFGTEAEWNTLVATNPFEAARRGYYLDLSLLTGGAGFSGNYADLSGLPNLNLYALKSGFNIFTGTNNFEGSINIDAHNDPANNNFTIKGDSGEAQIFVDVNGNASVFSNLKMTATDIFYNNISLLGGGGTGSDDQNIQNLGYSTATNTLTVGIEGGTSQTVDLSALEESAAITAVQNDVDQNEADADTAISNLQADVDQNETDTDTAISNLQADVDQNEADADAAIASNSTALSNITDTDDQNIESLGYSTATNTLTVGIEDGNSQTVDLSALNKNLENANIFVNEDRLVGYGASGKYTFAYLGVPVFEFNQQVFRTLGAGQIEVPIDPYDATTWDGNREAVSKNDIRDKIENLDTSISNQANVQADWDETTNTEDSFIQNKPTTITDEQAVRIENQNYYSTNWKTADGALTTEDFELSGVATAGTKAGYGADDGGTYTMTASDAVINSVAFLRRSNPFVVNNIASTIVTELESGSEYVFIDADGNTSNTWTVGATRCTAPINFTKKRIEIDCGSLTLPVATIHSFQEGDATETAIDIATLVANGEAVMFDATDTSTLLNPVTFANYEAAAIAAYGVGTTVDPTTYEITPADGSTANIAGWFDYTEEIVLTKDVPAQTYRFFENFTFTEEVVDTEYKAVFDTGSEITGVISTTDLWTKTLNSNQVTFKNDTPTINTATINFNPDTTNETGIETVFPDNWLRGQVGILNLSGNQTEQFTEGASQPDLSYQRFRAVLVSPGVYIGNGSTTQTLASTSFYNNPSGTRTNSVTIEVSPGAVYTLSFSNQTRYAVTKKFLNGGAYNIENIDQLGNLRTLAELE